ncbi:phosphoglycerate mutase-like protein [Violaceomyces palustris]|uniref:Phosphoglycerate mutase-like protein n=1 Tax=Violaceomyces palustris TaxID=1673888 RepID=A0ACD0P582_9BASI|nr:phosphoglycerate mutase-like protein [Violaceomyces palustris]
MPTLKSASLLASLALALTSTSTLASPSNTQWRASTDWVLEQHLGNLSPYFDAPVAKGLSKGLPQGCEVEQVSLVQRHGSRNPISQEIGTIANLSYYINNNTQLFSNPKWGAWSLPEEFLFLYQDGGWNNTFVTDDLSATGRRELFSHGVDFRLEYPSLNTTRFVAGGQDRVVESAQWFAAGYLGRHYNSTADLEVIPETEGVVSYITPMDTCTEWKYSSGNDLVTAWDSVYLPRISKRINRLLRPHYPGVNFTESNVHGMLWACAYDIAVKGPGSSKWCPVFRRHEIEDFEYELDLLMRGAFGYGLPKGQGPLLGSLYVGNLTERLDDSKTKDDPSQSVYLDFAHDTTIDLILTTLGLAKDDEYPSQGPVDPARKWRTSYQVPFAARMEFLKLSCSSEGGKKEEEEKRIQLLLNKAPVDLSELCGTSFEPHGTCPLNRFLNSKPVLEANKVVQGDPRWVSACGAGNGL